MELLVATNNAGKVAEFAELLRDLPVTLRGFKDLAGVTEVEETGATFEKNAVLKARGYALQAGMWALADDSGLEIEALGGRPGVLSARYAGEGTGFDEKIRLLLGELAETGDNNRRARFVCVIALADERGIVKYLAEGVCPGRIALAPSGMNGFGYDPIFIPDEFEQTFGELSSETKEEISHRALASVKIIRFLRDFIGD